MTKRILIIFSAGIGRTGTVIVIDVLIHLLEEQGRNFSFHTSGNFRSLLPLNAAALRQVSF